MFLYRPRTLYATTLEGEVQLGLRMAKTYDYLFKLLLIGDSGVGKTCVLFRFSEDAFNATFISTIGRQYNERLSNKSIKICDVYISAQIHCF